MTDINDYPKLKPCPFCGASRPAYKHIMVRSVWVHTVDCRCGTSTAKWSSKNLAVAFWNKRSK